MREDRGNILPEFLGLDIDASLLGVVCAANMEEEEVREADFLARQRASGQVTRLVEKSRKFGTIPIVRPQFAMKFRDLNERLCPADLCVPPKAYAGKQKSDDDPCVAEDARPVSGEPVP